MKKGTFYARKLKQVYGKFRGCAAVKSMPEPTPPVEQLIVAVLSQETSTAQAQKVLKRLGEDMVDYNELRVSTPEEVAVSISKHVPHTVERATELIRLLNAIYQTEYAVSLDSLTSKGVREIKSHLEKLDGITPYVTASVLLWSLGGHAIPVSDRVVEFLKEEDMVDPGASCAEVQAFLERHVSAADARSFCLDLEAYVLSKSGKSAAQRKKRPTAKKKITSKTKPAGKRKVKIAAKRTSKAARKTKKKTRR